MLISNLENVLKSCICPICNKETDFNNRVCDCSFYITKSYNSIYCEFCYDGFMFQIVNDTYNFEVVAFNNVELLYHSLANNNLLQIDNETTFEDLKERMGDIWRYCTCD